MGQQNQALNMPPALDEVLGSPDWEGGDPEELVRSIHAVWKVKGGTMGGKPRHSDRYLSDKLRESSAPVRSLTPKLTRKTRIKGKDAEILLRFFLTNWPDLDVQGADQGEISYTHLCSTQEICDVVDFFISRLEANSFREHGSDNSDSLPGQDSAAIIKQLYEDSDVMITVSTENTLIVSQPRTELIGFRNLINELWAVEKRDKTRRPLIWVIDVGREVFDDVVARSQYLNVQQLITRFKALRCFDDRLAVERWEWLRARCVIAILDTRYEGTEIVSIKRRPLFVQHHLSLAAVPPAWLVSSEYRALYGSNLERVSERSFSVFCSLSDWASAPDLDTELRYLGHALFTHGPPEQWRELRALELPSPGKNSDDAFATLVAAAMYKLSLAPSERQPEIDGKLALEQLKFLGYRVLNIEEFLSEY